MYDLAHRSDSDFGSHCILRISRGEAERLSQSLSIYILVTTEKSDEMQWGRQQTSLYEVEDECVVSIARSRPIIG